LKDKYVTVTAGSFFLIREHSIQLKQLPSFFFGVSERQDLTTKSDGIRFNNERDVRAKSVTDFDTARINQSYKKRVRYLYHYVDRIVPTYT